MPPQMPLRPPHLRRTTRINTQSQTAPTNLAAIALTRHSALALVELRTRAQRVPAEALSTVFGARHAEPIGRAIGYTFGVRDGVLADVRECDSA